MSDQATPPEFKVPEAYANEPWAKGIDSIDSTFKMLAGAQHLIGKKGVTVPEPDSPPEVVQAYRQKLNIPEDPSGYVFENPEPQKDVQRDLEVDLKIKQAAHKHNLPAEAVKDVIKIYETEIYTKNKPILDQLAQAEKEFDALMTKTLGTPENQNKAMLQFQQVMKETLGEGNPAFPMLDKMGTEDFFVLTTFAKAIHDKYVGEGKLDAGGATPPQGDLKSSFDALSAQKRMIKNDPKIAEYDKLRQITDITKQMVTIADEANKKGIILR